MGGSSHPNHTVLARRRQDYLTGRNANARHPDILAAQRRERARVRGERRNAGATERSKPPDPANVSSQRQSDDRQPAGSESAQGSSTTPMCGDRSSSATRCTSPRRMTQRSQPSEASSS